MWYEFGSRIVVHFYGRDARRYLNNRLTADLRSIEPGAIVEAAALNPQGRVEGIFLVICEDAERYTLVATGGVKNDVIAALARYKVADRVSIEDRSDAYRYFHVSAESSSSKLAPEATAYSVRRLPGGGSDILIQASESRPFLAPPETWGAPLTGEGFDLLRFKCGSPIFPAEISDDGILSEFGMKAMISFSKGCYVGQEVIERSDALGRLPRKLERIVFEGQYRFNPGEAVLAADQSIGKVLSSVGDTEKGWSGAFAMLRAGRYDSSTGVVCAGRTGIVVEAGRVIE